MKRLSILTLTILALTLSGCEELENLCGISGEDLGFTEDYNKHLNAAIYIYQQTDRALRDSTLKADGTAEIDGASCTRSADSIIVDFGNGVSGSDGRIRKGSYRIGYSGDYMTSGSTANMMLKNYSEDDKVYAGGINLTNVTSGAEPSLNLDVMDITVDSLKLSGSMLAVWQAGFETTEIANDDRFALSGGLDMTNTNTSDVYNGVVNSPLVIDAACQYSFVEGNISLTSTNPDVPEVGMDFIAGDCANLFNATIDCEGNALSFSYPIK